MHRDITIDSGTIVEWAENRADDAGRLARQILSERSRSRESLEWCLAEIEGRTVYTSEGQFLACMDMARAALQTNEPPER